MPRQPRPRTGEERQIAREKAGKRETIMRVTGGLDATERQYSMLHYQLGEASHSQVIRWVEFSNQVLSGHGTLNRFDVPRKVFLSRIYFIRAINMAMTGWNELTNVDAEIAYSFGMTEAEFSRQNAEQLDMSFPDLPPLPG